MTDSVPSWCKLGYFIDAKDSMNDWCVAQVIDICEKKKTITVIHDGWGSRSSTYPFRSSKIAPFRKDTAKYTGPRRGAVRDWKITEEELADMQTQVTKLLELNLETNDAFYITQFYRGKLFIFVENLLTCDYKIQKQFLKPVVKFFGSVINLIVSWLKKAPDLFPYYYKSITQPDLYLEDGNTALALAWPELMDTLNKLFALDSRVADFFQTYDEVPSDYEPSPLTLMNDKKYSETLMYIINLFTKEKGFEAVISILKETDEQKRVPFPFIATTLLYVLGQFIVPDFWNNFNLEMTAAVYQRIDIISELELKDLKHEDIIRVLGMIRDASENLDLKKFTFFLRMIKSNYFEKRIKGLTEINSMIESLDIKIDSSKLKLSREELRDWIIKNNVIEQVVSDRPHVELVKRSSTLFKFLALCKALEPSHLEILWKSIEGKHESYIRATYLALMEFVPHLDEDLNDYLYRKIQSVPLEKYDESFLTLIKDFTAAALTNSIRFALHNRKEYSKLYGLEILDNLMLDSSPVDFCKQSCKYIGAVLAHALASKLRTGYLKKLLKLITTDESVPQALKLLTILIKGMRDQKRQIMEINQLNEEFNLVDLILKNLKLYLDKSRQSIIPDIWNKVVHGRFTHEYNLKIRLQFIEFLMFYSGNHVNLTEDNIQDLWEMLGESELPYEKNLFFEWITKGIKKKPPLDDENFEFIFESLLMDNQKFPSYNLSEIPFACFKLAFLSYHFNQKNIEITNGKLKYRKSVELKGFEKLIDIQLNSEKVSDEAGKLIISLLLRYSTQTISKASKIQEDFTDSLLAIILQNKDNDLIVARGLNLFKMLLGDIDSDNFVPNSYVYVHESLTHDFNKIQYDQHRNLRHLRKEIAKHYKKPLEYTFLKFNDKIYSGIDDDVELTTMKAHCIAIEFKCPDYEEYNPLPDLSLNQKVIKSLFELLSHTEKSYTSLAWSLLVALPTNQQLEEAFESLQEPIEKLLDETSLHKLIYELMIIEKFSSDPVWTQKFINHKGLEHLLNIFYNDSKGLHAAMRQESLIKTISNFLTVNTEVNDLLRFTSVFFSSILTIVEGPYEVKDDESLSNAIEEILKFINEDKSNTLKEYIENNQSIINSISAAVLLGKLKPELAYKIEIQLESIAKSTNSEPFFFNLLFALRETAFKESNEYYWKFLAYIVKQNKAHENLKILVKELIEYVQNTPCERSSNDKNLSLCGALTVLSNAWTLETPIKKAHMRLFLIRCLFEIPETLDRNTLVPPICKHSETRNCAFNVILELCKLNSKFLARVIKELEKFHEEPDWRSSRRAEWSISAVSKEKSQSGLVGIKNLGCTCYMNSLLQQLFMLKNFRDAILASKTEAGEDNLLYQLQYLFSALQCSDKQYINPKAFTKTVKDYDGNPINVNEQMDVDELFNYFMEKLEGYLKDSDYKDLIKVHFGGLQVTELIGKDCIHRSERYEPFLSISVEVKNKKSLQEGLESFVAGEILEGENAYQCDHCEAKVRAVRRVCIKHLPNHLIIALRRFEFDFDSMTRMKLNDFCEFPIEIDMEPYTQEGIERYEKEKEKILNKDVLVPPKKFNDDYYNYKLRGIVIHAGTAESGHYYSYINDLVNNKWFEFNDIWVKEFNPNDIPDECFGGEEKFSWSSVFTNSPNTGIREKCGNAYLLFYERTGIYKVRNPDDEQLEPGSLKVELSGELAHLKTIKKQNQKYWRNKHIFAFEYSRFVFELSKIENMPFKFAMKFTLTILLRTKEKREEFIYMYLRLEKEIKNNKDIAKWVLDLIGVSSVCKELLLYCPMPNMRKIVVGLVKTALSTADPCFYEDFMLKILNVLPFARKQYTKSYAQYLEILKISIIANKELLDKYKIVKTIIDYLFNNTLALPDRPADTQNDIFLGYDHFQINDNEKTDLFYSDNKSASYGHIFHLLYLIRKDIPENYQNILQQAQPLEDLLRTVDNKLSIRYFGKLYSYLMTKNLDLAALYLNKLLEFFQASDFFSRSRCYKLFTPLLLKTSVLQKQIVEMFLKYKFKQIKMSKFVNEVELFVNYIFTLCSRSKTFQSFLREKTDLLSWIEKWVKDNMHYGFSNVKGSQFEENPKPTLKSLYIKCQKILKNEELFIPDYWDSDDEIDEDKLQKGKYIDTIENNGQHWAKAFIKERIGDLLYVQIKTWDNSDYAALKETYGDDIAPPGYNTSRSNYS